MKNLKLIFASIFFVGLSFNGNANVTENFNHGNECISRANCWRFCRVDVRSYCIYNPINTGANLPLAQTSRLNGYGRRGRRYYSTAKLYSPYTAFNGSGDITFKHKLSSSGGKYAKLQAYLIDDNGSVVSKIFEHVYKHNYSSPNGPANVTQMATIPITWTGVYKIKWYWKGYTCGNRGLIDDIDIDGTFSANPCRWCKPVIPTCVDTDGDGCCDDVDDYPNDATKCNTTYEPGKDQYLSVAYEDRWPHVGDYDFNDMVIDRSSVYGMTSSNLVVDVEHELVVRASGATFHNGFGIQMPALALADIASVTGAVNPNNYTATEVNGLESGQTKPVIVVWEDWNDVIISNPSGIYFNTRPADPVGTPDTVRLGIVLTSAKPYADLDFDPFLMADSQRGSEIHLPWFRPTDLADTTLFNTLFDASDVLNVGNGNHYVDVNNRPWAIQTASGKFDYPKEFSNILASYNHFATWALSNGTTNNDWYYDLPGYRNAFNIY